MNGWRDTANCYRELLRCAAGQQARVMLRQLAHEAEAIAEDIDKLRIRDAGNAERRAA